MRDSVRSTIRLVVFVLGIGVLTAWGAGADTATPPPWTTLPPKGVRELYSGNLKLKVDARLAGAMMEAHLLLSGSVVNPNWAEEDLQWIAKYKNADGRPLPDFPDFTDLTGALDQWLARFDFDSIGSANKINIADDEIAHRLSTFTPLATTKALREIDRQWHSRPRASLVLLALRGYTFLLLDSPGRFVSTDALASKALALLAIYQRLAPIRPLREECLLAHLMDYSTYALKLAESLPGDDPIKFFVNRDFRKLLNRAGDTDAPVSGEARYFTLQLAAYNSISRNEFEEWRYPLLSRYDGQFVAPAFIAAARLRSIDGLRRLSEDLSRSAIKLAAAELGQSSFGLNVREFLFSLAVRGATLLYHDSATKRQEASHALAGFFGLHPSALITRFEELADALPSTSGGPFFSGKDLASYYRDRFYSGLYQQALFHLDVDHSIKDARIFLAELGLPRSPDGREFTQWFADLLATSDGSREPESLLAHFSKFEIFGFYPRLRSYSQVKARARGQDQLLEQAALKFMVTLDSRPQHLNALRLVYNDDLLNFNLAERVGSELVRLGGSNYPLASAWYAKLVGDRKYFDTLLSSHSYRPEHCAGLVGYLEEAGVLNTGEVSRVERELVNAIADGTECMVRGLQTLREQREFELAHSLAREWLNQRVPNYNDDDAEVAAGLALVYLDQGKASDAWRTLKDALSSRRQSVLLAALRTLDLLKNDGDAERVAKLLLERFPLELSVRAQVAGYYWRHGRIREATALLKNEKVPSSPAEWGTAVGEEFARSFAEHPVKDTLAAYMDLKIAGIDAGRLSLLAEALSTAGQGDRALPIAQDLVQLDQNRLSAYIDIYRFMRRTQTQSEAVSWLEKTIPGKFKNDASFALYDLGDLDGMETFNRAPASEGEMSMQLYIDLLRVAAWMIKNQRGDHLPQNLVQSFGTARPGLIFRLGKFMLKFETLDHVLPTIGKEAELCMASYYFGLLAATEKDFVEATDWWAMGHRQICSGVTEFNWSGQMLKRIQARAISTRRLAKEGLGLVGDFKAPTDQPY